MAGEKLTHTEVDKRVDKCLELRYKAETPILFKEWIKYCHKEYGDKSEQQYTKYWSDAKEKYEEAWRAKLTKLLDPAMNELHSLLADDDPKVRQRAIDQIVKYTGNDIEKIEAKVEGNIQLNWGTDPGLKKLEEEL
jgi:translation initiation factor 2 alpha subunit (eIF-2alpha)